MISIRFGVAAGGVPRVALLLTCFGLALTFAYPSVSLRRTVFDYVIAIDITQSMNVTDYRVDGQPVSRLAFAKRALRQALHELPCGSKVGWAVFTEYRTLLLFEPVEVCASRNDLVAVLERIDNRMAWAGASEIAKGLHSAVRMTRTLPGRPALVFVTDGHEAPPIDRRYSPKFEGKPGDVPGIIIGVGGSMLSPIPKSDPEGHSLGFWQPEDVRQIERFSHERGGSVPGEKMVDEPGPPWTEEVAPRGLEHLSSLKESHLRQLAHEAGLSYRRLENASDISSALQQQASAQVAPVSTDIRSIPAALALLSLLMVYTFNFASARKLRQGAVRGPN